MTYRDELAKATVKQLRVNATAAGIIGRSKMNKAELVDAVAGAWKQVVEFAHADAIELDEKRSIARASLGTPAGVELSWDEIEHFNKIERMNDVRTTGHTPPSAIKAYQAHLNKITAQRGVPASVVPAELCDHGIKRGRKCSICREDAAKMTKTQRRAIENVFTDSTGTVRVDVEYCRPQVRDALEQLGLVRRSRWDLTEEGLRLIEQLNITPRTNTYDHSDLSWLGDNEYVNKRLS